MALAHLLWRAPTQEVNRRRALAPVRADPPLAPTPAHADPPLAQTPVHADRPLAETPVRVGLLPAPTPAHADRRTVPTAARVGRQRARTEAPLEATTAHGGHLPPQAPAQTEAPSAGTADCAGHLLGQLVHVQRSPAQAQARGPHQRAQTVPAEHRRARADHRREPRASPRADHPGLRAAPEKSALARPLAHAAHRGPRPARAVPTRPGLPVACPQANPPGGRQPAEARSWAGSR